MLRSSTCAATLDSMIHVIVILEIDPERVEEFLEVILENARESRKEAGCLRFDINRQFEKANWFALSEAYLNQASLEAHYETAHFAKWKEKSATGFVLNRWAVKGPVIEG